MNKVCIPKLRFSGFEGEWEKSVLNKFASLNPKNLSLPESFIYIDLESVTDGHLIKENVISKNEAPSRAQRVLKQKDILYQTVRPYQKNNLYFNKVGDYVASTGYAQIRTKNDTQFLFQFLHTEKFVANVMLRCTGTSYPAINSTDLSSIEISFPSLPEQQKIASFLSSVDEKIQQLSRKKELLEQYKKGVMQQLFSRKLRFKDENGDDYPNWEEKKLGEVCEMTSSKRVYLDDYVSEGIPFYRGKEISELRLNQIPSDLLYISKERYEDFKFKYGVPLKNDILITAVGTLGNVLRIKNNDAFYFKDGNLIWLRNISESSRFLEIILQWETKELIKTSIGSTQKALTMVELRKLTFNFPCFEEQQKIANFLSGIDDKIENTHQEINNMQGFKKGLLQQMFV